MPFAVPPRRLICPALPLAAILALIVGAGAGLSQIAGKAASSQSAPASAVPALRASVQLVVVDVVVTDKDHKPVHGLKLSDFTLTEDGKQQAIGHFEEHTALTPADAAKLQALPKLPPGIFTNYSPAPANGAVTLLLLDALNTPWADQAFVRQQLLKFLEQVSPGTRIAIFGLTSRLTILQSFTTDPALLKAVLDKKLASTSFLLDDAVGGSGTHDSIADRMEDSTDRLMNMDNSTFAEMVANVRQMDAQQQSFQLQQRAQFTLDAMSQIARYLSGIPGRKNLIWLSGSFPINILPDMTGIKNPFAVVATSEDEFRETVDLLAKSQVAVYPIDARGVMTSPIFHATTSRNYGPNPKRMNQDNNKFFSDTSQEHGTMTEMAQATGGRAFVNTNGLAHAVESAIDEGSNFYTLSYTPANQARDGEFRRIKVQVAQKEVNLSYRQGYYAKTEKQAAAVGTAARPDLLRTAMMRGAPTPEEILLRVGVFPLTPAGQTEPDPAPGNKVAPNVHGPYSRYRVNSIVEPLDIAFLSSPDGKVRADLDLLVFVYNPDGTLVNAQVSPVHINGSSDEVKQALAHGIFYQQEVSAPAKGEYFLRIAVHDLNRDRFGAVEVATSAVKNVVPRIAPIR